MKFIDLMNEMLRIELCAILINQKLQLIPSDFKGFFEIQSIYCKKAIAVS